MEPKKFLMVSFFPDPPDEDGKYDDRGDADDEEATCPEDFDS